MRVTLSKDNWQAAFLGTIEGFAPFVRESIGHGRISGNALCLKVADADFCSAIGGDGSVRTIRATWCESEADVVAALYAGGGWGLPELRELWQDRGEDGPGILVDLFAQAGWFIPGRDTVEDFQRCIQDEILEGLTIGPQECDHNGVYRTEDGRFLLKDGTPALVEGVAG